MSHIFWSGPSKDARCIHGVRFAIRTTPFRSTQETLIAINMRIITLRLPLIKNRLVTFVSVYAPILDRLYDTLYFPF